MTYESIYKFTATTNSSKSTIYRFYDKNPNLFDETKKKGKRLFPIEHARYFNSQIMFEENKVLTEENKNLKNLIYCFANNNNSFLVDLWRKDWTFFCTIPYRLERNQKSCFKQMHNLYDYLESKYSTDLRFFFTTENFTNRKGCHNHFILHVSDTRLHEKIKKEIEDYFSFDRTDVQNYDKMKAGIFYIAKDGLTYENWDILGNNLGRIKDKYNG